MSAERTETIKPFLPSIILLVVLLVSSLLNSYTVTIHTSRWQNELSEAQTYLQSEDFDDAISILQNSYKDWSKHQFYLHFFLHHEDVDAIEKQFLRVIEYAKTENDEASPEIAELLKEIHLLGWEEQCHIQNIF